MHPTPFILCVDSHIENNNSFYGRFQIGPLPVGHGLTVGNALRRILLSEIPTLGITAAKIQLGNGVSVPHEYSSLPGLRESTLDLLLNLREVTFQYKGLETSSSGEMIENFSQEPILGFLHVSGPKIIYAKDFKFSKPLILVDPDKYIATLNEECALSLQIIVNTGKNGKPFFDFHSNEAGFFLLNPTFNPIYKINYKVEPSNIIDNTEQIQFELHTNGTILPVEALKIGIFKIQNLFNSLILNPFLLIKESPKNNVSRISNNSATFPLNDKELDLGKNDHSLLPIELSSSFKKRLCTLDLANFNLQFSTYIELKKWKINTLGDLLFFNLETLKNVISKEEMENIHLLISKLGFKNE